MNQSISHRLFTKELNALFASINATRPDKEIRVAFARLRRLHANAKFATVAAAIEAGRDLGALKLLWVLRLAPRARLEQAA